MEQKDSLTVREAAYLTGVSVQTIYNRLEKEWKPYLVVEDGKKRLHRDILKHLEDPGSHSDSSRFFPDVLKLLERQSEQFRLELEVKNEQIRKLSAALADAQKTAQALACEAIQKRQIPAKTEGEKIRFGVHKRRKKWRFWK